MKTSARNHFNGKIVSIEAGAVNDEIVLKADDGLEVVAVITRASTAALGLQVGTPAFALVKASSVIVMVDVTSAQVSARNAFAGTVLAITKGAVNSEVVIGVSGGAQLAATITNQSVDRLALAEGKLATAIFKASSVIVGVTD